MFLYGLRRLTRVTNCCATDGIWLKGSSNAAKTTRLGSRFLSCDQSEPASSFSGSFWFLVHKTFIILMGD